MHITAQDVGEVVVFYVEGELRGSNVTETTLHEAVKSQLERGRISILLNLEKVEQIDSFGVGQMLASYTSIQNLGGKMKLTRIPTRLRLVLKVTWLDHVFEIFDNEAAALKSFTEP